jgi:hypothetical protein
MRNSFNVFSEGRKRQGRMRFSPCKRLSVSSFSSLPAVALAKEGGAGGESSPPCNHKVRGYASQRDTPYVF